MEKTVESYVVRNQKKLELPARLAVAAVIIPVLAGAALDGLVLMWSRGSSNGGLWGLIVVADLCLAVWQGVLLGKAILAQAAEPPPVFMNFIFLLGRGSFIGALVGLVNGLIMAVSQGPQAIFMSGVIGLGAGAVLGLLAGIPFSIYMRRLETR